MSDPARPVIERTAASKSGFTRPRRLKSPDLTTAIQDSRDLLNLPEPFDLGVLLVHGMGEQQRGQTLATDGKEILDWLKRRVETAGADGAGKFEILIEVMRGVAEGDGDSPAHVIVQITPPKGKGAPAIWLIAEGWWAESFPSASDEEFVRWARVAGPLIGATLIADIGRRLEIGQYIDRRLLLLLVPIRLLIGAFMVVLGALAAFGVTGLAFIARWAPSWRRTLAAGHGDAYLFAMRPAYRKLMADKVRADLAAVSQKSRKVAIVAHSMGTGVAWDALTIDRSGDAIPPVQLFITYGQGLRKLFFALEAGRPPELAPAVGAISRLGAIAISALAVLVLVMVVTPLIREPYAWITVVLLGAAAVVAAISGLSAVVLEFDLLRSCGEKWDRSAREIGKDWSKLKKVAKDLEWLDLWGSADPAPVGPLGVADEQGKLIGSYKIRNRAWPPVDHDVYWLNGTEYLPIVLSRLFALGGPKHYATPLTDARLEATAMRRHARVHWLVATRVLIAGAFIGSLVAVLVGFGLPSWAALVAALVGASVLRKLDIRPWRLLEDRWETVVTADEIMYFQGVRLPLWSATWRLQGAVALLLASVPVVLLLLLGQGQNAAVYLIAVTFAALLALTVMSGGGCTFGRRERQESLGAAMRRSPDVASAGIILTALLVLAPLLAKSISPGLLGAVLLVEVSAVLLVMAYEGLREYQLFKAEFDERNAEFPRP